MHDCPLVRNIWQQLGVSPADPSFFTESLEDWLTSNCEADSKFDEGQPQWHQVFLFAIWLIWKNRNQFIFKGRSQYPNLAKEIKARTLEYMHCACNFTATKKWVLRRFRWEKLDTGWMKLNTNGASNGSLGFAGGGGVIRDEEGNWVIGYARRIGPAKSFLVELWALRDGLFLCLQAHIQVVIIEMDAKAIVDAFSLQKNSNSIFSSLMDDCR